MIYSQDPNNIYEIRAFPKTVYIRFGGSQSTSTNKNFIKTLTEKLLSWTGERWLISLSKSEGAKSFYEKKIESKSNKLSREKENKLAKEVFSTFSDAKLVDVKEDDND